MNLKDLVKIAAPIAIGSIAPGLMPGMNPILSRGLASGIGSLVMGGKPKDALLAGALGAGVGALFPGQQAGSEQLSGLDASSKLANLNQSAMEQAAGLTKSAVKGGAGTGAASTVAPVAADTMSAKLLESIGIGSDNLLFKALNTKLGEGVAAGLIAQLLAGDDDDEVLGEFERRPFGAGGPGGKIGGINYAQGGAVPSLMALSEASRQMADNIRQMTTGPRMSAINTNNTFSGPAEITTMPTPVMGRGTSVLTQGGGGFASDYDRSQNVFEPAVSPFANQIRMGGLGRAFAVPYKDGGATSFPRRNGGIDPSEGSGTKDDVPAMLMAGEFVMTRDAVKGMGDGNLRKGINRMYGMMDNLERMA